MRKTKKEKKVKNLLEAVERNALKSSNGHSLDNAVETLKQNGISLKDTNSSNE